MPYILEKVGDWDKMMSFFNNFSESFIHSVFEKKLREDGNLIVEKIKEHISSQDLGWTPLAESTVRRKGSSMIYVNTGSLVNSIQAKEVKSGGELSVQVGAGGYHESGVTNSQILEWLEYGTHKIPPRPLIRPTYDEMQKTLKSGWVDLLNNLLRK